MDDHSTFFKGAEDVLDAYASQGWRTLSFSQRLIRQPQWDKFMEEYNAINEIVKSEANGRGGC